MSGGADAVAGCASRPMSSGSGAAVQWARPWDDSVYDGAIVDSNQTPIDALTRDLPPATRDLLAELTALLMSTVPEAKQKVNLGWKSVNFSHPKVGYFCGLFPVDERVIVTFEFGVLLSDPDGVLDDRGCAKQVRYLPIRASERIPKATLQHLLHAAVSLPGSRADRMALVRSGARPDTREPTTS